MKTAQFPNVFASVGPGLGAPKHYFPVKNRNRAGSLVVFFFLMGCSALVFLDGLYFTYLAYQKHGQVMLEEPLAMAGSVAFVLFLAGLASGWWAYVNWNKGVMVYERGFAVRSRKGIQLWRWEDIISLKAAITRTNSSEISTGTRHVYHLINSQNQRLVISDAYLKVEELAMIIQDAILPGLYERAAQQYNAGQRLVFGPVAIGSDVIQIGKKSYAWDQVQQVSIQRGILKVSKKEGGWFSGASARASDIPNLNVLLNMIHQVVGLQIG